MKNFYAAKILNKVWSLALVLSLIVIAACDKVDPDGPDIANKCFDQPEMAWAIGERFNQEGDRVLYVEIPPYDQSVGAGGQIVWLDLGLENSEEVIGAVKFRELLDSEVPKGANPGEYIKLLVRIDEPLWYFVPQSQNIKVEGYAESPTGEIPPDQFETHKGVATQETGSDWEYYIVVLPRFNYYEVNVEVQKQIKCVEGE
ncbi:hypothetical protein QWY93_10960 [Echinicola jeungdonensis]|uniref:Uncharacterized protein n=1 Tax=Echinicola jeungdonensis TaxID=709343 RepID=A0ABV5J6C4_9BACT|nr:hypothetical protein [Echinicola jeungdonensis]MDN3669843.1 hypothetical protein [Echinicola jeungdonensis]